MKESDFQARITATAKQFGWKVWHVPVPMVWDAKSKAFRPSKGGAGLPDLILLHDDPPRLVFLELKREGGKLSDKQREFLQAAKLVAERAHQHGSEMWQLPDEYPIGVIAAWPEHEEQIIQMLRTKVVT